MKNARILAVAAASMTVGLAACGSPSAPEAQPVPPDKNCTELAKPNDPSNLIGHEWPWMSACSVLSDVQPGVDETRAAAVVFDARAKVLAAKMQIVLMATDGNKLTGVEAQAPYRAKIENIRGRLASSLVDSRLALQGAPPEGFRLGYVRGEVIHTASPAWTGAGR
ncbi:hypothetical protein ACM0BF_14300 [Mycobacteroides abscessus subsp. abscessus]|uniref:hypothetical protein n=1 Tax=Mycobacteroides abscessus TaxID=36809 RepID=UPI0039EF7798